MNWTESPKHEFGSLIASHKHRSHFSVVVQVPDWLTSDLGFHPRSSLWFFYKFNFVEFIEFDANYGKTRVYMLVPWPNTHSQHGPMRLRIPNRVFPNFFHWIQWQKYVITVKGLEPGCYPTTNKTYVRGRIFKPSRNSVIISFPEYAEFSESSAPFRKNSIVWFGTELGLLTHDASHAIFLFKWFHIDKNSSGFCDNTRQE